ncbi:hypothetical protein RND71_019916 [Anisodus tanguticus]|uniref:Uncharacterized protein n=1 Tax=Anisodus tanguticus TaxID=243964 RepID=A0AAE1S148_9SOLA|nr:hypothetical protein RND71_019916 [Anisodus tanguticus]
MMTTQSNNFSSHVRKIIVILLLIYTICSQTSDAGRVLKEKEEYILLPSLQKAPVRTPTPNPGTGARTTTVMTSQITESNFAGRKEIVARPPLPSSTAHVTCKSYYSYD